jgi:hypothetical protein
MLRRLGIIVATCGFMTIGCAEPVTLVADGQAAVVICAGEDPSETVTLAADELREYLGKMSGAEVAVVETVADGEAAILLGEAAGVDLSGLGPEGSLLRTLPGNRLVVAGRTDMGTLNAAYDLLDLLGVRWLMPGEFGEHVPELGTIIIPETDRSFEPSFAYRRIWAASNRLPAKERDEYHAWQRRNRMPGWLTGNTGHAYARIVSPRDDELFAAHPEYFSLIDGERKQHGQICFTNPEVRERARDYARKFFTDNPDAMMVSMSPNDGYNWCECDACKAEGSMTDNALSLANYVAEMVAEEFPDKYVAMYAYAPTGPPPSIEAHERVIIWIADGFIQKGWDRQSLFEEWAKKAHHLGDRDYYSVCAWSWEMPRYDVPTTAADLRWFHDHKTLGISAESEDNFGSFGVDYWVAARLMHDLDQDVDALLDDYFASGYGPAAEPIRRYWERWGEGAGVSVDKIAMALRNLQEADRLAAGDDAVLDRIRALKCYLHYLRLYREYGQAAKAEALGPFAETMTFGYSAIRFHQVMIPNVLTRLAVKGSGKRFDVDKETIAEWRGAEPITVEEIAANFADDLAHFQPLDLDRAEFSQDLVALGAEVEGTASAPAYRGAGNEVLLIAPEDGVIGLAVTSGMIRKYETVLIAEDMTGAELDRVAVPAGVTQTIEVDHGGDKPDVLALAGEGQLTALEAGRGGLVRLRVQPQAGSACRIDFGDLPQAVIASQARPLVFISGTRGPLYFHVPAGTTAFGVGLRTPDHHGRLRVFAPDDAQALEQAGDYVLGEEFRVDVPNGQDDTVWSLTIDKCEDCSLYLIGAPPYLSQTPGAVLAVR